MDGTQDQSLAVVFWPHISGGTVVASTAAAGIVVRGGAYQDLALDVQRLCGSQELESLKSEAGIGTGATDVGIVGVIHRTATGETDSVTGEYYYVRLSEKARSSKYFYIWILNWLKKILDSI